MIVEIVEGKKRAVGVEKAFFLNHYHEDDDKPKELARSEILHDLLVIEKNLQSGEAKAAAARHKLWLDRALSSSVDFLKTLNKRVDMKTYIKRHPGACGKQVSDALRSDMDPHAICNMKSRMKGFQQTFGRSWGTVGTISLAMTETRSSSSGGRPPSTTSPLAR